MKEFLDDETTFTAKVGKLKDLYNNSKYIVRNF
jgi:hypothetical protein